MLQAFQIIKHFPHWEGIFFVPATCGMKLIYDWYLSLGWIEIRRWHTLKPGDIDAYNKEWRDQ